MPCKVANCDLDDNLETLPCTSCGLAVHHICSNEITENIGLDQRVCSFNCLHNLNTASSQFPSSLDEG